MSKRSALPQYGDRKKAKLDISRSEHHLPLSQNISSNKENNCDEWGDDVDEEILLQASQACEEEQINDISMLPDYNNWKQPGSTSTQYMPSPSTSKPLFEFKKPSANLPNSITTHLKSKCNTISSPLPGISTMSIDRHISLTDELAISEKIIQGQDPDIRRQMLQFEEKYNKLKSEYGKLQDKFVTKEGEASILRSQFKNLQMTNDNLRMEKIRVQEQIQMAHNEKLAAVTKELQNLKTQLEFKDLEILSVKDKFKKLEASKLRLTQITDISRNNNTLNGTYDGMTTKKAKMTSNSAQTEDRAPFLKLNKTCGNGFGFGTKNTFNSTTKLLPGKLEAQENEQLQLFNSVRQEFLKLETELESAESAGFQDSDERVQPDKSILNVLFVQLTENRPLYNGERGVEARLQAGVLASALQAQGSVRRFFSYEARLAKEQAPTILDTAVRICRLIEKTPSGFLYSGFLAPLISILDSLLCASDVLKPKIFDMAKAILLSKPMPFVSLELLGFVRRISSVNDFLPSFCPGTPKEDGMDVDRQNVNTDLCYFVLLLKQAEDCLSYIRAKSCGHSSLVALRNLLDIFEFVDDKYRGDNRRCECVQLKARVLVHALRDSVEMLERARTNHRTASWHRSLLAACRSCTRQVYKCVVSDGDWLPRLQRHEGLLSDAVHTLYKRDPTPELSELKNTFQTSLEDAPPPYLPRPLLASFESFSMTD